MTAMMHAAYWGHFDVVEFLAMEGADVNARSMTGSTVLMAVVRSPIAGEAHRIAMLLLQNGARIDAEDNYGMTARSIILNEPQLETERARQLRMLLELLDGSC